MPAEILGRALYALAGLAAGVLLTLIYQTLQPPPAPGIVTIDQPARVLTKVEKVTAPCETVQAYAPAAKRKLKLPAAVVASPTSHVLASSDVKAAARDTRISTVLDTATGAVDTYTEALPLPWLRAESQGEVGAWYGVKAGSVAPVGRLQASYDVLQIKAAHVGVMGSVDTDGDAFAGVGIRVKW